MTDYYVAFIHPDVERMLRDMAARLRYKTASHRERYKRRYGHYPIVNIMELGRCEGFRFIVDDSLSTL